mmetsp:Transcript_71669/g.198865  ORF Transcript_71669/g.198865 Transcript_71669/m.198865 type:complete len:200 (-) Transcript_71669:40-639(-)
MPGSAHLSWSAPAWWPALPSWSCRAGSCSGTPAHEPCTARLPSFHRPRSSTAASRAGSCPRSSPSSRGTRRARSRAPHRLALCRHGTRGRGPARWPGTSPRPGPCSEPVRPRRPCVGARSSSRAVLCQWPRPRRTARSRRRRRLLPPAEQKLRARGGARRPGPQEGTCRTCAGGSVMLQELVRTSGPLKRDRLGPGGWS